MLNRCKTVWKPVCASLVSLFVIIANPALALDNPNPLGSWEYIPMAKEADRMQAVHIALLPNGKVLMVNGSSYRDSMKPGDDTIYFGANVLDYDSINNISTFDPSTDTYQRIPAPDIPIRNGKKQSGDLFCAGLLHLTDGRVMLAGGTKQFYPGKKFKGRKDTVIFDWKTNQWHIAPDMTDGRWYPTLIRLANEQIAVFSGILDDDFSHNSTLIEFYNAKTDSWTRVDMKDLPGSPYRTRLPGGKGLDRMHHYPRIFPMPTGQLLISHDGSGMGNMSSHKTYLVDFEFKEEGKAPIVTFSPGPERLSHNKVYSSGIIDINAPNNDILLTGGQEGNPGFTGPGAYAKADTHVVRSMERLKIDQNGQGKWSYYKNFLGKADNKKRVMHNMVYLPNKQFLIVGGGNYGFHRPIYEPDLMIPDSTASSGYRLKTMAPGNQPRLYHSNAILLPDGRIFVVGGNANRGVRTADGSVRIDTFTTSAGIQTFIEKGQSYIPAEIWQAEYFSPPYLTVEGPRPAITSAPEFLTYQNAAVVKVNDADTKGTLALISLGAPTHGFDSGQRFADLKISKRKYLGDDSTELSFIAPIDKLLYPPGYYMLFFVNESGKPSIAKMVQLH